jgi:hypothetical protein
MSHEQHAMLHRLVQTAQLAAAATGAIASYDFGLLIGGLPLAVLLAANGAFVGAVMVGFVADLAWRKRLTAACDPARRGSSG